MSGWSATIAASMLLACSSAPKQVAKPKPQLVWLNGAQTQQELAKVFVATVQEILGEKVRIVPGPITLTSDKRQLTARDIVLHYKTARVKIKRVTVTALEEPQGYDIAVVIDHTGQRQFGARVLSAASGFQVKLKQAWTIPGLQNIPNLRSAVGLPMKGKLEPEIRLPTNSRWKSAAGTIKLSCPSCAPPAPTSAPASKP